MIVTVHLLCGRGCRMGAPYGGVFYIMIIQLHSRLGLGACSPRKILKKIVSFGAFFVYIWIRFVLNNF